MSPLTLPSFTLASQCRHWTFIPSHWLVNVAIEPSSLHIDLTMSPLTLHSLTLTSECSHCLVIPLKFIHFILLIRLRLITWFILFILSSPFSPFFFRRKFSKYHQGKKSENWKLLTGRFGRFWTTFVFAVENFQNFVKLKKVKTESYWLDVLDDFEQLLFSQYKKFRISSSWKKVKTESYWLDVLDDFEQLLFSQ
jgi:hypothetical protein